MGSSSVVIEDATDESARDGESEERLLDWGKRVCVGGEAVGICAVGIIVSYPPPC